MLLFFFLYELQYYFLIFDFFYIFRCFHKKKEFLKSGTLKKVMLTKIYFLQSLFWIYLSAEFTYYIEEEKDPKMFIGDVGKEYKLKYANNPEVQNQWFILLLEDTTNPLFHVTKEGKLYTIKKLDAEALCVQNTECSLMVKIAVRFDRNFKKILKVKVVLQDINDHKPEFPEKEISVQFSESDREGKLVFVPNAVDRDVSLANSQIFYKLKKNPDEPFALSNIEDGTSELNIYLEKKLDREYKDSYTIQVIAEDGGNPPRQSILDVYITVTDENDNRPIFSQNVYNVTIKNEAYGLTPIVNVFATDLDIGKNGEISYHLSSQTSKFVRSHFKLNKISGEIFLRKKFTSDKSASYKLFVKAMDGGYARLSALTLVLINVVSSQNSAPKISVDFLSRSMKNVTPVPIPEDISVGSFVAYVMVTDKDPGDNGEVSCTLQQKKFQLEILGPKDYKVTVKSPLDRETEDLYNITISCKDKGTPQLQSENKFSIQVVDVNDVQPQFSKGLFKFWTYENQKLQFPVGFINATDPDKGLGGELTYSLLADSKSYLPFQIASNGLILTTEPLDHEFQDTYEFQVLVKDKGTPSLNNTANIIIKIMDENDNAPYFEYPDTDPYTLEVHYPLLPQNNITVVRALDNDSRENAFLKYQITKGNQKQLFNINQFSGQLSFNPIVTKNDAGLYNLQIVVKDSGYPVQSAMTTLCLVLTVANETAQSLSAVQITSDIKVHKNLVIVIVLIAMIVSVAVVVCVTLSIVWAKNKCQGTREEKTSGSDKGLGEQTQLISFSRQTLPQRECPIQKQETSDKIRDSQLFTFNQESGLFSNETENDERRYDSSLKHIRSNNGNPQVSLSFRIKLDDLSICCNNNP